MTMGHHGYLYEGPLILLESLAHDARERFGFAQFQHPDVHIRGFDSFGIEESRTLISLAHLRHSTGRALFVVGTASFTSESQQALLKLLEEPQEGSVFVFLVPHGALLPTVRSRLAVYPVALERDAPLRAPVQEFLKAPYKERSAAVAELVKDSEGARERVRDFLDGLEHHLRPHVHESAAVRTGLEDIAKVRSYLTDRAPSLKMLLEHLALTLPRL